VDIGNVISDLLTPFYISSLCAALGGTEENVKPIEYVKWGLVGTTAYKVIVCGLGYMGGRGESYREGKREGEEQNQGLMGEVS
jgi:hypothetical protein